VWVWFEKINIEVIILENINKIKKNKDILMPVYFLVLFDH